MGLWGTLWENGSERPHFSDGETEAWDRSAARPRCRLAGPGAPALCLPADPPSWPPQLHHACAGPGLSLLCLLRHDVLEYFSIYGTALSMWVSLMGEWPPPAAQPCTRGSGCPTARRPPRPAY